MFLALLHLMMLFSSPSFGFFIRQPLMLDGRMKK